MSWAAGHPEQRVDVQHNTGLEWTRANTGRKEAGRGASRAAASVWTRNKPVECGFKLRRPCGWSLGQSHRALALRPTSSLDVIHVAECCRSSDTKSGKGSSFSSACIELCLVLKTISSSCSPQTTALKNGSFRHDIHYWLGEDTSQDEAGTAAILTVELDAALGGRAVHFNEGKLENISFESLAHELLQSNKCYLLDCGVEMYVWMGRNTSLQERKAANEAAEKLLIDSGKTQLHVIKVIEGFETVMFKSKFREWPATPELKLTAEDGRGKVAALLKSQGLDVKGLMKAAPVKEEPQSYIDCSGHLKVWRVNGNGKTLLSTPDQSKFYTGDCYVFQYTYTGDDKEECLIGTWFGKKSVESGKEFLPIVLPTKTRPSKCLAITQMHGSSYQRKLAIVKGGPAPKSDSAISALTSSFEGPMKSTIPKSVKGSPEPEKAIHEAGITEDGNENEDDPEGDEGRTMYPYERLTTTAEDPVPGIDVTKREASHWTHLIVLILATDMRDHDTYCYWMQIYLSSAEFGEKFGMSRAAFDKLPKWKQNKLKSSLMLF
ncbi:hypothetical protein PR202_gb14468 [Eleusine coracana subsp. coracana]|uniref:HP domain-containing protein n=1 Tax=Eleusine coracana subsp. coracana TaxID=191504 RepID=A0AAV5EVA7_ELECO|nr:hypothetical protein PR202_gb14468 [Eleusine coracana subsp. coracana]